MADNIAIVTRGNRGIGLAVVRELCRRGVGTVYLTTRDAKKGQEAVEKLNKEGYSPLVLQLEVTDRSSVQTAANIITVSHGGFDILINNAGIIQTDYYNVTYEEAQKVIEVNYRSILLIQEAFFPLLNENGRVINISSDCGHTSNLRNEQWIAKLTQPDLTVADIDAFVDWFLDSIKNGTWKKEDFSDTTILSYRISKVALCALTRIQQKQVYRNVSVNSLHPGFVETDMTSNTGDLKADESSKTPVWLALDAPQTLKGAYIWFDKTEKEWTNPKLDLYFHFERIERLISARMAAANASV